MTYKELAEKIAGMPEERQLDDVSISLNLTEEIIPALRVLAIRGDDWASGVLDDGHFVITVDF